MDSRLLTVIEQPLFFFVFFNYLIRNTYECCLLWKSVLFAFVNITLRWHLNVLAFACSLAKGSGFNLFVHILLRDLFFSVWKPIIWIEGDLETIEPVYKCKSTSSVLEVGILCG